MARVAPAPAPEPRSPAAPPPIVRVDVEAPEGATIEVDGRSFGLAPIQKIPVPEGRRRFVARLADGSVQQRTIDITADRTLVVFY